MAGPLAVDHLLGGDAKLISPVGDPDWPYEPPVLLYVNNGVVSKLEAIFESRVRGHSTVHPIRKRVPDPTQRWRDSWVVSDLLVNTSLHIGEDI